MTLEQAVRKATGVLAGAGIASARFDAELLLSHALQKDRTWVFTHANDELDGGSEALYDRLIDRRSRREPLQYITGVQEFWGLEFAVTPKVLIPRPETEFVVESAIRAARAVTDPVILDLCTGSGCIAVSLATELASARVFAADRSEAALAVARKNAQKHGVSSRVRFLEGDLFQPVRELDLQGRIDVLTANPPYIQSNDLASLQPEVRDFEPEMALISGPSGTEIHGRILTQAPAFLKRNGALIMEMGIGQAEKLTTLADNTGAYTRPEILKDLAGIERVIKLQRK